MRKRRSLTVLIAAASLLALSTSTASAAPSSDDAITAKIQAFIVANPFDYLGIDKLVFKYLGEHIQFQVLGSKTPVTAAEAAALKAEADAAGDVVPMSGIPTPWMGVGSYGITGGKRFWGSWDYPNGAWAGQGSPVDIAGLEESTDSCTRTQNGFVDTYSATGSETSLGSTRTVYPNQGWLWNIRDYTTNFTPQADHGTVMFDIVRTSLCGSRTLNVGVAFDYEGNLGCGITGVSMGFWVFAVSYSCNPVEGHWGTDPTWVYIYP